MNSHSHIALALLVSCLMVSCTEQGTKAVLSGNISNASHEHIYLKTDHIHYKFSKPELMQARIAPNGDFEFSVESDSALVALLVYDNKEYPIYLYPGAHTLLSINHAHFPSGVNVSGDRTSYYEAYKEYLKEVETANRHARTERRNFIRGQENNYLNIKRLKIQLAKEYLADTPFSFMVKRHVGEYLVSRLEDISNKEQRQDYNRELARRSVLNEALHLNFFTYNSLKAQRAGIRDFAHAWIHTFGIENRLLNDDKITFVAGNWIRTAGKEVRDLKWALLDHIKDDQAKAHAAMYFIAEELGDYDYTAGVELLQNQTALLASTPAYTRFLTALKDEVGKTQPGKAAVNFAIQDQYGETVRLDDLRGSYVLLDFWASWCVPCIEEFPHLEDAYESYSRSDLEIVSISLEEERKLWENALQRFPKPWIQLYDGVGFEQKTFRAYRAGGIPFYVLIGRDGTIIRNNDFRPSGEFKQIFDELLYLDIDHTYAGR